MIIIDRRDSKTDKNTSNRERFIRRYRKYLKGKVEDLVQSSTVIGSADNATVSINWSLESVNVGYDHSSGCRDFVVSGNNQFKKGDWISQESEDSDDDENGSGGESEDSYQLTLTKDEFFDLYFSDMELPDFVKESFADTTKMINFRAGYSKDGPWNRLDIIKTFQLALARKIANKSADKKQPFLDDCDLRYRNFAQRPQPMLKAVLFMCMDVSGSMEKFQKYLSKKFFMLLYLFLDKNYQSVEVRFIRYHHEPKDCSEQEFFYSRDTGGTEVLPALELINEIIEKEYPLSTYNIYIAHTSDGDTGLNDSPLRVVEFLDVKLLPKVQYYAYVQVMNQTRLKWFYGGETSLFDYFQKSKNIKKKLNTVGVSDSGEIFPVLHNLFKKRS